MICHICMKTYMYIYYITAGIDLDAVVLFLVVFRGGLWRSAQCHGCLHGAISAASLGVCPRRLSGAISTTARLVSMGWGWLTCFINGFIIFYGYKQDIIDYIYIFLYTRIYMHAYKHTNVQTDSHAYIHVHMIVHIWWYIHVHTCIFSMGIWPTRWKADPGLVSRPNVSPVITSNDQIFAAYIIHDGAFPTFVPVKCRLPTACDS